MPKTLNPNNNFPTSITNFPISGNNEPIAIEPLEAAIQAVLDRTENLHQSRLTVEGVGVKRIRQFASRSALSAASGFADGDIVSVDGYGLYRLFTSSAASADGLWVLTATGGGRWIHIENDLKGANGGLAMLDSGGRLSQDVRDASILTQHIGNSQVTSAKLAPGAVVGHLGYTPLNRAGDTMSGSLNINTQILQRFMLPGQPNQMGITWPTATDSSRFIFLPSPSGVPDFSREFSYNFVTGRWEIDETLSANRIVAQDIQGRYDHQNRFVVQSYLSNSVTIPANSSYLIAFTVILVPSGKAIYLRRVRYVFTTLLPRVQATNTWTGSAGYNDVAVDILLASSSSYVYLYIVNNTSNSEVVSSGHGIWAELEIR